MTVATARLLHEVSRPRQTESNWQLFAHLSASLHITLVVDQLSSRCLFKRATHQAGFSLTGVYELWYSRTRNIGF